ncbi:ATP-binding protein [Streptomyces xinghaiensis]|uniref:ATP-binding protein n=1 Tax=Streptomyces xinghaiensis TaxID=1038928 RepID=UPI000BB09089|nr:ATP-binding protein [Streptomyces xinghaiensis]
MTQYAPEAVFWCLVAGLLAALVLLVRQRGITKALRRHAAALEDGLRARDQEARHLVEVRLPAMESSQAQPGPMPGLLHDRLEGTSFAESLQTVIDLFTGAADRARTRADQSAKAALKSSMRALQGLANEQQLAITDMQDHHDNPHVLQDLLEIDHANAQFGRRAQGIAVLCGSWPGRQRAASSLVDVVRGAKGRIRDYRRVEVHAQVDLAVVSRAVEPVVLAVAELLDNAARHSQPNTQVEVTLRAAHNGTAIVIDDAGVGMDDREIQKATLLLSGRQDIDINRLGDPPQFGFAVIGVLAARYGFSVSVDTRSPYGGVRAVLFLPKELLTSVITETPDSADERTGPAAAAPAPAAVTAEPAPAAPAPAPAAAAPAPPAPAEAEQEAPEPAPASTALGLPKRRRREPVPEHVAATRAPVAQPGAEPPPARPAHETASRMGAFARGTRSGRLSSPDDEGTPQR